MGLFDVGIVGFGDVLVCEYSLKWVDFAIFRKSMMDGHGLKGAGGLVAAGTAVQGPFGWQCSIFDVITWCIKGIHSKG